MKRLGIILLLLVFLVGCTPETTLSTDIPTSVDIDLTQMAESEAYEQMIAFRTDAIDYVGKVIRLTGYHKCAPTDTMTYHVCVVNDVQTSETEGLEFELEEGLNYPEEGAEITISGVFETYMEGENLYCHLTNAKLESVGKQEYKPYN